MMMIEGFLKRCFVVACLTQLTTAAGLYDDTPEVIQFKSIEDYNEQVMRGFEVWGLMFYRNEECEGCEIVKDKYAKLAKITRGLFKLAVVDVDTQWGNDIAYYWKLDRLPYYIVVGDDKENPLAINPEKLFESILLGASTVVEGRAEKVLGTSDQGKIHQALSIEGSGRNRGGDTKAAYVREKPKVTSVVTMVKNPEMFDEFVRKNNNVVFAAFVSPGGSKNRNLRRQFEETASRLVGESVTSVWINGEANPEACKEFDVRKTPTIMIFPGGEKNYDRAYKYTSDRMSPEMAEAVIREVDRTGKKKEVVQLTSEDVLLEHCSGYNHVCVMGIMPPLVETGAEGREKYLAILKRMQTIFRGSTYSFLWFEAGTQPDLESAMGISYGYPALATYTLDRNAFSTMRASFSDKGISKYLHGVAGGINAVSALHRQFKVQTIQPWDGKDAPEDAYDDEIPLSEIMDDWDFDEVGDKTEKKEPMLEEEEDEEPEDVVLEAEPEDEDDSFFRDEL